MTNFNTFNASFLKTSISDFKYNVARSSSIYSCNMKYHGKYMYCFIVSSATKKKPPGGVALFGGTDLFGDGNDPLSRNKVPPTGRVKQKN